MNVSMGGKSHKPYGNLNYLFVQQRYGNSNKKHQSSTLLDLCEGNLLITDNRWIPQIKA